MEKMMTYSEANEVLDVSLSPTNRCLSKAVAIANDADEDLLADFTDSRLVPASVVEQAVKAEVLHFFCDENGNDLGTNYTIDVPEGQGAFVVYTRILIDGQTPNSQCFDLDYWISRTGQRFKHTYYYRAEKFAGADNFSYVDDSIDNSGIIRHVFYADNLSGKIESNSHIFGINWSSEAKSYGVNIKNTYDIQLNINPISHSDYSLSKTILYFGYHNDPIDQTQRDIGYTDTISMSGFTNPTVTLLPKVSRILSEGSSGSVDTAEQFSSYTIDGNTITFEKTALPGRIGHDFGIPPSSSYYADVYLISDSDKYLYVKISNGMYKDSYYYGV